MNPSPSSPSYQQRNHLLKTDPLSPLSTPSLTTLDKEYYRKFAATDLSPPPLWASSTYVGSRQLGKRYSPTRDTTLNSFVSPRLSSSTGYRQLPSLPGRTVSSDSPTKRNKVSVGARLRRTSRSRSTGGSSIGRSRSRSREPPSAGSGHAGYGQTQAVVPLNPAPIVSQKNPAIDNGRGRASFSAGHGIKARGVVRRNSGGPGLRNEIDAMKKEGEGKEQADVQLTHARALEVKSQRYLQPRVRRKEKEIAAGEEQAKISGEEQRKIERQRWLEFLVPNPVIGSNPDEERGLGSKSAEHGLDASSDKGARGLYSRTGMGKKERAGQEVLAAEKQRVQNPNEQPQLEEHVQHHQKLTQPQQQHQSQQIQPRRLRPALNMNLLLQTQPGREPRLSSEPPLPLFPTKQFKPRELELLKMTAHGPAPLASKQTTNNKLLTRVVSRASDFPQFAWTALHSKEVDANTILPPLLKCRAMEQEGSVTPNQLWIIIYISS